MKGIEDGRLLRSALVTISVILLSLIGLWTLKTPSLGAINLLWPCFLLGRMGLSFTFWAALAFPILMVLLFMRYRWLGCRRTRATLAAIGVVATIQWGAGFAYINWVPVPAPVRIAEQGVPTPEPPIDYLEFEQGYRLGIVDHWVACGPLKSKSQGYSRILGLRFGLAEFESLFPPLIESSTRKMIRAITAEMDRPRRD